MSKFRLAYPNAWGLHALLHIPQPSILSEHTLQSIALHCILLHCIALHCIALDQSHWELCPPLLLSFVAHQPWPSIFSFLVKRILLQWTTFSFSPSLWPKSFRLVTNVQCENSCVKLKPWWQFPRERQYARPVCLGHFACTENPALRCPVSSPVAFGTWAPYIDLDRAWTRKVTLQERFTYLMISSEPMFFLVQLFTFSPPTIQWERQGLVGAKYLKASIEMTAFPLTCSFPGRWRSGPFHRSCPPSPGSTCLNSSHI